MLVTKEDLFSGLTKLGVGKGDSLIVHSSLSSFGVLEDGARTLIATLQDVVTAAGLLMMPVFTYGIEPFDKCSTPSRTGHVTEVFRRAPKVFRSEHPSYSVCLWGNQAYEFSRGHDTESSFGVGSPMQRLLPNSKILLVGVDYTACSMIHVGQELSGVRYLDRPKLVSVLNEDKTISSSKVRRAGCSLGFNSIALHLDTAKIKSIHIGGSLLRLVPSSLVVEAAVKMLEEDPTSLFCNSLDCFSCDEARGMLGV